MDLSLPTGGQGQEWARALFDQWSGLGDNVQLIATFAVLGLAFGVSWLRGQGTSSASENTAARAAYQRRVALPAAGNRGFFGKRLHHWVEPITIAGVTVETKDKHIAIGATTGARKTTLIANMIMQARRPCVVIAGDNSPYAREAMLARGWRIWSADGKHGGLYVHEGTPNEAAQIVTVLLNPRRTTGDTGLQRGMARGVFRAAYVAMDEAGIPRSWPALRRALLEAGPPEGIPNRNFDAARANWLARIDELMEALGPALGHDISVLDCVRSECGLFFDLNAFSDLDMATSFGEAAVRLTQHAADKTGDFWWICDELALFDADLLGQIVRTCRIRRVKFVGASQIISDFGKTLRGLVKVWFVGEQTSADHESRKWCSELTMGMVPPENFSEHATPPGFYYVVADGRTQSIKVKPWHHPRAGAPMSIYPYGRARPRTDGVSGSSRMEENGRHWVVSELVPPKHPGGILALPPPSTGIQRLLKSIYVEGECERWAGKHDKDGYGLVWLDGRWQKVHRIRWELAYGPIPLNEDGTRITVDHMASCPRDCSKLAHLTLCTRGENSRRRWRVRGVGASV